MESKKPDWPDEALGLRLLRLFLSLPPEKRQVVLEFVEEVSGDQEQCEDGAELSPP